MNEERELLRQVVQGNCNIADALHAGDYSMCIYLLKMREYYRWEAGLGFGDALPRSEVGNWLSRREALWEGLQDRTFAMLEIDGEKYDPFDTEAINRELTGIGLVYSGGYGPSGRPHFFLASLQEQTRYLEYTLLISAQELARGLTAFPAMTLGRTIFVRRESLRRMLWEQVEQWRWNRPENAMGNAISCYDFEANVDVALEAMTDNAQDAVVRHEIGEVMAGDVLGDEWEEMLISLPRSRAEFLARAVRDNLADCLSTLPALLKASSPPALHFFVGTLSNLRKELFPSLLEAYRDWLRNQDAGPMLELARSGAVHWRTLADQLLTVYRREGDQCAPSLEARVLEAVF